MILYSARLSLFGKKVEIALAEKGLPFERILVPFTQSTGYSPKHPDVLAINPKGQVPVLLDDGCALYDSTVIIEYLEDAYPQIPLFPDASVARARCRQLEVYADEVMLVPLRSLMHRTSPRPDDLAKWTASEARTIQSEAILSAQFEHLDILLKGESYLCGAFGMADIAVFMMVYYTQRLGGPRIEPHQHLTNWYNRLKARSVFASMIAEVVAADLELSTPVEREFR